MCIMILIILSVLSVDCITKYELKRLFKALCPSASLIRGDCDTSPVLLLGVCLPSPHTNVMSTSFFFRLSFMNCLKTQFTRRCLIVQYLAPTSLKCCKTWSAKICFSAYILTRQKQIRRNLGTAQNLLRSP